MGSIASYNSDRAYGFLRCDDSRADIYFHRNLLPEDLQPVHGRELSGTRVEFEYSTTRDGKDRCERLWVLGDVGGERGGQDGFRRRGHDRASLPPQDQEMRNRDRQRGPMARGEKDTFDTGPPPELDAALVEEMTKFLEEKGGVMDYGRFTNRFSRLKKCQLEPHFKLVPEVQERSGGRWQIMLHDVEPLAPEEREERERKEHEESGLAEDAPMEEEYVGPEDGEEPEDELPGLVESDSALNLELSASFRLLGSIREWDRRTVSGFADAAGYEDVVVETDALPSELRSRRDVDLAGCEVTFEVETQENGQFQARDIHFLMKPHGNGGWGFRRV